MSDFKERIAKLSPQKLALLAVSLQSKLDHVERTASEPIAIVGMGCRIPGGADSPESLWRLLRDGVDAVGEIPGDRWDVDGCYSPDPDEIGKMYTRQGAFLKDIDRFDPHFFGIAPREALTLDPQQRLLLEVTWEALEHAAQPIDALMGSQTGVFVGVAGSGYLQLQLQRNDLAALETYVGTGGALSVAAGRLSHVLGLQARACRSTRRFSSLVALHLACRLADGECRWRLPAA
jgi:acyl transferase domain-containing protein